MASVLVLACCNPGLLLSVLIALQAANILFFLLTVYYLVEHWRNSAGMIKSETKGNFMIVIKLFFIMGKIIFTQGR